MLHHGILKILRMPWDLRRGKMYVPYLINAMIFRDIMVHWLVSHSLVLEIMVHLLNPFSLPLCDYIQLHLFFQVVLCANSKPALNDVTYTELLCILEKVCGICPILGKAISSGQLSVVSTGHGSPCLDFR